MNTSTAAESGETGSVPEEASAIGAQLRQRRESLGYSIADVANELRILRSQLEAMEAGRFSDLPETPFAIGFLRSYARFLELDADGIVLRFRSLRGTEKLRPPPRPQPSPEDASRLSRFATLLTAAAIVVLASVGWYYVSFDATPVGGGPEAPGMPPPRAAEAETRPPPRETSSGDATATGEERATATEGTGRQPPGAPEGDPPAASDPFRAPPDGAAADGAGPAGGADPSRDAAPAAAPAGADGGNPPDPRVVLRASSDTYVLIRTPDGRPLFARLLRAGESYEAPAGRTDLRLDTGNAGALEIVVGGRTLPPLGAAGAVVRDVSLDPRKLAEHGG